VEDEIDLREYFAVLSRRRWTVIAVTVVAVLIAGVLSFVVLPPVYEASLLLQPARNSGDAYSDPNSLVEILQSEGFIVRAVRGLGLRLEAASLQRMVKASVVRNTQLVGLSVRAGDLEQARRIADALANLAVEEGRPVVEAKRQALQRQLSEISRLLDTAPKRAMEAQAVAESRLRQGSATAEEVLTKSYALNVLASTQGLYNALLDAQKTLTLQVADLQPPKVLWETRVSRSPVAPRKAVNVTLAAVLGVMAGTIMAFFQEFLGGPAEAAGKRQEAALLPNDPPRPR
jgi:capsular polysaccharide biosynthesis protein